MALPPKALNWNDWPAGTAVLVPWAGDVAHAVVDDQRTTFMGRPLDDDEIVVDINLHCGRIPKLTYNLRDVELAPVGIDPDQVEPVEPVMKGALNCETTRS